MFKQGWRCASSSSQIGSIQCSIAEENEIKNASVPVQNLCSSPPVLPLVVPLHAQQEALLNMHHRRYEGFQMKDDLTTRPCSQLVERCLLYDCCFHLRVYLLDQVVRQMLQNQCRWDGVNE